ncbi:MAG TPA: hypothetical protein VJC00_02610 [Candidatus Nanoarchaeia archaeon]|nr:hypothetical protein [Candidatus Nanoarchaeia archaeon]
MKPISRISGRKKAFVFSLDILIAVFIVILVMTSANRHMLNAEIDSVPNMQMVTAGSDIVALLDHEGILQTLDDDLIESEMNDLLPQNLNMMMKIAADDGTVLYLGDSPPEGRFVGSGMRFFTIKSAGAVTGYAYAVYWVWAR